MPANGGGLLRRLHGGALAFSLNSAAYCSEDRARAAIKFYDKGQNEAAGTGLSYGQTMRTIIIPQSIRR